MLAPAPEADLITWVGELYIRTGHEKHDQKTRIALIRLYVRELGALPGPMVEKAIRQYRGEMFPALDRLRSPIECSPDFLRMREILKSLRRYLINGPDPVDEPITPEERQTVSEGFARLRAELGGAGVRDGPDEGTAPGRPRRTRKKTARQRPVKSPPGAPDA